MAKFNMGPNEKKRFQKYSSESTKDMLNFARDHPMIIHMQYGLN
jgi:hypothetical protein